MYSGSSISSADTVQDYSTEQSLAPMPDPGSRKSSRSAVACTRCRKFRSRCVYGTEGSKPVVPCQSCIKAGVGQECMFVQRGYSSLDREVGFFANLKAARQLRRGNLQFRRRPIKVGAGMSVMEASGSPFTTSFPMTFSPELSASAASTSSFAASTPSLQDTQAPRAIPKARSELPSTEEIILACRILMTTACQIGFLHAEFVDHIAEDPSSITPFLLFSMLAYSSRYMPALITQHGSVVAACRYFQERAEEHLACVLFQPSAQHIQGCIILGICYWGSGQGTKYYMIMGVAIRMAVVLNLHRESTYSLGPQASIEQIIESESLRRTFWVLKAHDHHLSSGSSRSASFAPHEIDALLPSDEDDFLFGVVPVTRSLPPASGPTSRANAVASLPHVHSIAALRTTSTASVATTSKSPSSHSAAAAYTSLGQYSPTKTTAPIVRSLFATMILSGELWCRLAQFVCWKGDAPADSPARLPPWDVRSEHHKFLLELKEWEANLPVRHQFSQQAVKAYRTKNLDLAVTAMSSVIKVSYIVLCRSYGPYFAALVDEDAESEATFYAGHPPPPDFWQSMMRFMMQNVVLLYDQLEAIRRSFTTGLPLVLLFCAWIAGDVARHITRWPQFCPDLAPQASQIWKGCVSLLHESVKAWPLARYWHDALRDNYQALGRPRPAATDNRFPDPAGDGTAIQPIISQPFLGVPNTAFPVSADNEVSQSRSKNISVDSSSSLGIGAETLLSGTDGGSCVPPVDDLSVSAQQPTIQSLAFDLPQNVQDYALYDNQLEFDVSAFFSGYLPPGFN